MQAIPSVQLLSFGSSSVWSTSSADASAKVYPKSEEKPKFVELQLRHVVAPADGGPKRTVTEASFQIPFLKHLDLAGIPGTPNIIRCRKCYN